jgi:hypothetical protein
MPIVRQLVVMAGLSSSPPQMAIVYNDVKAKPRAERSDDASPPCADSKAAGTIECAHMSGRSS